MSVPNPHTAPREFLRALYDAAVARALPAQNTQAALPPPPANGRTLVLGAGKAGGAMAAAVDALWPKDAPLSGLVVTRYDHVPPAYKANPGRIEVVEASHPVPDEAGRRAAQRIAELTKGLTADDLVLCLISGGGSATLSLPAEGITLEDKQAINKALLKSGAAIDEMNCVRKHLSAIKGGRLAAMCAPAKLVTLTISDVPGDDPAIIASGPTVADPTTAADAVAILARYRIELPPNVRRHLEGPLAATPKPGDPRLAHAEVRLIAAPQLSLEAAAATARAAGVTPLLLGDAIEGEAREVGKVMAGIARSVRRHGQPLAAPAVLLSGGETTVTVRGDGRGGRNVEYVLALAVALDGLAGIWGLAGDTDGIDGAEEVAGAIVTPDTLARARAAGLSPHTALAQNDAHSLFAALGDQVITGPTLTNVNDFRAVLVLPTAA